MQRWVVACAVLLACAKDTPAVGGDPPLPGVELADPVLAARLAAADAVRGGGPYPYTNRLALETSPYLLQHAHNPVSWWAWGDAPFERARREHKLVLVSVGYSTCHWCHVMEAESFSDPDVAAYLNANFICIKVDREERPDVDSVYMRALQAMRNSGGWPMNVIVDPDRRPVFGATYMSKPQLLGVMKQLRDANPDELAAAATELVAALDRTGAPPANVPGGDAVERGARMLARSFDTEAGGFGRGTKFPSPPDLELLLRYHRRTGDADALAMVTFTLERIASGGIHDQVGGGFHRYATDRLWLVPHFEKMLYDNAQLAVVYLEAAQITGDVAFAHVARDTLDYLAREMQSPTGAFYSATDADSRGPDGALREGRFFTWTGGEIDAALGPDAGAAARAYWGVGGTAQVDGRSVLHAAGPEAPADLDAWRAKLYAARAARPAPARDDKLLTSWNALAISAFARAGFAFKDDGYLRAAARAADDILAHRRAADGSLLRSVNQPAMLDDAARLTCALLDLFEATWDPRWLTAALETAHQLDRFVAPDGGYFGSTQPLLVRDKPTDDGVEPSGNATTIAAFLRLAELTGDDAWRARADRAFSAFASLLATDTRTPALRADLDRALDTPLEIVIIAPHALAEAEALLAEVRSAYLPDRTLVATTVADLPALAKLLPLLDGKTALGGAPTAFVCERTACKQPTSDPGVLATQLAQVKPLLPDRSPRPLR